MTEAQIISILDDLGYEMNRPIKMSDVSSIYLVTDNTFYPSDDTRLVFSNEGGANLLLIYRGYEDDNGDFVYSKNYPDEIISFSAIAGFTLTGDNHIYEPFKYSLAV